MTLRPGTTLNKLEHRFIRRLPFLQTCSLRSCLTGLDPVSLPHFFSLKKIPGLLHRSKRSCHTGLDPVSLPHFFSLKKIPGQARNDITFRKRPTCSIKKGTTKNRYALCYQNKAIYSAIIISTALFPMSDLTHGVYFCHRLNCCCHFAIWQDPIHNLIQEQCFLFQYRRCRSGHNQTAS